MVRGRLVAGLERADGPAGSRPGNAAMFESLSTRLQEVFRSLRGEVRLTEETVEAALREIRLALLEADVNFKVVKAFVDRVARSRRRSGSAQEPDARPAGHSHRPRRDAGALRRRAGRPAGGVGLAARRPDARTAGLGQDDHDRQAGAWLAKQRTSSRRRLDRRAPAGRDRAAQSSSASQSDVAVFDPAGEMSIRCRARAARVADARNRGFDVVIVDTAGRLHIDDELMDELEAIKQAVDADRSALRRRCDDRPGRHQERRRVQSPRRRHRRRAHQDGRRRPRRRGAARSCRSSACRSRSSAAASGIQDSRAVPRRSRGVAHARHGRRAVAHREGRSRPSTRTRRRSSKRRFATNDFTLDDFRDQLRTIKRMGPLENLLGMLPGMSNLKQVAPDGVDEKAARRGSRRSSTR